MNSGFLFSPDMKLHQGADKSLDTVNHHELAQQLIPFEHSENWIAEPKIDGHFSSVFCSANGNEFYSRNCKKQSSPELEKIILPKGMIVVGELGVGTPSALELRLRLGHEFVVIHRILQTPDHLLSQYPQDATKLNEIEQRQLLELIWKDLGEYTSKRFQIVPRYNKHFLHQYCLNISAGGEGLILKSISPSQDTTYKLNSRSQFWVKLKEMITTDLVIISILPSDAKTFRDRKMASAIVCGAYVDGKLTPLTSVGTMDHQTRLQFGSEPEKYIGRVVEIAAFAQFSSGALRHPSFVRLRDDKESFECVWHGR